MSNDPADLILVGGRIWTGPGAPSGPGGPTALAVRAGRVQAVGADREIEVLAGPETRRIRLDGRRVVPGFIDNHTHFVQGGFTLAGVQLRDAVTPAEFTRRIATYAREHPDRWMRGGTWDHELWGGDLPHRDWIDTVTGTTPAFVQRLDGHMGLANSRALELAGITRETADPSGGTIVRDAAGRPTGILKDAAQDLVFRVMPAYTDAETDRALAAAAAHAVERGVTHVTDMGRGSEGSWGGLAAYRRARAAGTFPLRAYVAVPIADSDRLAEYVAEHGRGDGRVAWGAVKGFVDGSLGSTTAWFYEPYHDAPETSGLIVTDTAALRWQILEAHRAGLHVLVHAIGDRANDWLLDVFAEAGDDVGPPARPFHIEHAQHLTPRAISRFAALDVVPSMQPYHAIDDGRWAEKRIGPDRIRTTYAFRSLLNAGAPLTFGSDWTVAPLDPLLGVHAAVTRRTIDGAHPDGWVPEQKITVEEALVAYTAANAHALGLGDRLGTLEPGTYADLVVLDRDPFGTDPVEIERVRVDLTMVEGQVVFRRE